MKYYLIKIKTISVLLLIFALGLVFASFSFYNSTHSNNCLADIVSGCEKLQAEIKYVNSSNVARDAASYPGQYSQYEQNNQNGQYHQYGQYNQYGQSYQAADSTASGYQMQNAVCPYPQHDPANCLIENCDQCNAIRHGHARHNSHCGH